MQTQGRTRVLALGEQTWQRQVWATFLRAHMGAISGADFFTVEVLRPFGLVRYFVFFVSDIASRRVHIAGISNQPSGAWMTQIARNLTDCFDAHDRSHPQARSLQWHQAIRHSRANADARTPRRHLDDADRVRAVFPGRWSACPSSSPPIPARGDRPR